MLLLWQRAELEDIALSDSEAEEEPSSDGNPVVRYATHEDYQR